MMPNNSQTRLFTKIPSLKLCFRWGLTFLTFLLVSACQTTDLSQDWPKELPPKQTFEQAYLEKRNFESASPEVLQAHLQWIIKFYKGTAIYPNGWLRVTDRFLASLDDPGAAESLRKRMKSLGIEIANEWARDNDVRLINSRNMLTWGNALKTAATRQEHEQFISKIEIDVQSLLSKQLIARDISYQRYYPSNDFDDDF